jgi:hypothetical protein
MKHAEQVEAELLAQIAAGQHRGSKTKTVADTILPLTDDTIPPPVGQPAPVGIAAAVALAGRVLRGAGLRAGRRRERAGRLPSPARRPWLPAAPPRPGPATTPLALASALALPLLVLGGGGPALAHPGMASLTGSVALVWLAAAHPGRLGHEPLGFTSRSLRPVGVCRQSAITGATAAVDRNSNTTPRVRPRPSGAVRATLNPPAIANPTPAPITSSGRRRAGPRRRRLALRDSVICQACAVSAGDARAAAWPPPTRTGQALAQAAALVESRDTDRPRVIDDDILATATAVLAELETRASPGLRQAIHEARQELHTARGKTIRDALGPRRTDGRPRHPFT